MDSAALVFFASATWAEIPQVQLVPSHSLQAKRKLVQAEFLRVLQIKAGSSLLMTVINQSDRWLVGSSMQANG